MAGDQVPNSFLVQPNPDFNTWLTGQLNSTAQSASAAATAATAAAGSASQAAGSALAASTSAASADTSAKAAAASAAAAAASAGGGGSAGSGTAWAISVTDFGAVGNGQTDCTAAIQAAISSATKRSASVVLFPVGIYRVAQSLTIPSGITLSFSAGSRLTLDSNVTVTLNGGIDAGLYPIFTGNGTVAGNVMAEWLYPHWWGATGNGSTDDTAAIQKAVKCAAQFNGVVFFPAGTYVLNQQIIVKGVYLKGAGRYSTKLRVGKSLGTGVPAIVLQQNDGGVTNSMGISEMTVTGTGKRQLGVKTAGGDGIRIDASCYIKEISVYNFDSGIVFNSPFGHISLNSVIAADNYYGIYILANNGDHFLSDCTINGNTFANIGINNNGLAASMFLRTHLGVAPYGIYQEAGTGNNDFLVELLLVDCRFESIGNGAIFTEQAANSLASGKVRDLQIINPGFSWDSTYRLPGKSRDYAIKVGYSLGSNNFVVDGSYPFVKGDQATWFIQNNYGSWIMQTSNWGVGEDIQIAGGRKDLISVYPAGASSGSAYAGKSVIPAGKTIAAITTNYAGTTDMLFPIVSPSDTGGLSTFILYVTDLASNAAQNTTSFNVRILGGTPTKDLGFYWRIK